MTYCRFTAFQTSLVFLLLAPAVFAHHSDTPHFFMDQNLPYEGVITEFKFVNPHAYVYFDVTQEDGSATSTRCELAAAITLRRLGWTEQTFVVGEFVRLNASPARREDNHCYLNELVLADGTVVPREDAGPVLIQEREASERPLTLANGQPNISGDWVTQPRSGSRDQTTQTAAALAAAQIFEYNFDHPALRCESVGIIHGWPFGRFPNQITQTEDSVIITYGYMDLERTVYLNQGSHPDNLVHTTAGHSIGQWQGNVLAVDTVAISAGPFRPLNEVMHSDQYQVTERFWFDDSNGTLVHEYTATDPLYFERPYSGQDIADVSAIPYLPYDCEELSGANNIRPEA